MGNFTLTLSIRKTDDGWIAHCMELDIVTTSKSMAEVVRDIGDLCSAQIQYAEEHDNWEYLFKKKTQGED